MCSLSHVLRNYAWHPDCIRQWLWVSKGRTHNGGTWWQRMEHAVKMVFVAVLFGSSVLIHCRQGKHRSGATGCFMFCLLTGCDFTMAMNTYRGRNQRVQGHDLRCVRRCWDENHMASALDHFRGQQWVRNMIGNILHKIFAPPVPSPLPRDRSRSRGRSQEVQAKRMPRPAAAQAKRMPIRLVPTSAPVPSAPVRPSTAPDEVGRDLVLDASRAADEVGRDRTPSPPAGHRLAWTCEACGNLNLRNSLHCSRPGCDGRMPQRLRAGDWECHQAQ